MQPSQVKDFFRTQIEAIRDDYVKDLEAMTDDQLRASPGGNARCAYDFTYETAFVNRRIAQRLRGETPDTWDFEGWVTAPEDFKEKEQAKTALASSMDEVIAAWDALPETDLNRPIKTATGETNPLDLAFMVAYHTGYHDAQLNYIQSLQGDREMHW